MKLTKRRGQLRLHLEPAEATVLVELLDELDALIEDAPGVPDPARARLFPAGYQDDEAASAEFRELTEGSLRELKEQRSAQVRAELADGGQVIEVALDDEATTRWLTVLNDLRLTVGSRLDVREDDPPWVDPAGPDADQRMIYAWLTHFQDLLLRKLGAG